MLFDKMLKWRIGTTLAKLATFGTGLLLGTALGIIIPEYV